MTHERSRKVRAQSIRLKRTDVISLAFTGLFDADIGISSAGAAAIDESIPKEVSGRQRHVALLTLIVVPLSFQRPLNTVVASFKQVRLRRHQIGAIFKPRRLEHE